MEMVTWARSAISSRAWVFARPHAPQEVPIWVSMESFISTWMPFPSSPEFLLVLLRHYLLLGDEGDVVRSAFELAVGNHHDRPFVAANQTRDVRGSPWRSSNQGMPLREVRGQHERVRHFAVLEVPDSAHPECATGTAAPPADIQGATTGEQIGRDAAGIIPVLAEAEVAVGIIGRLAPAPATSSSRCSRRPFRRARRWDRSSSSTRLLRSFGGRSPGSSSACRSSRRRCTPWPCATGRRSGLRAHLQHALGLSHGIDQLLPSSMVWHIGFSR